MAHYESKRLVIPAKTKIGAIEITHAQLNKATNIPKESSCQGEDFSPKINKENLSSKQAIELINLQKWKEEVERST